MIRIHSRTAYMRISVILLVFLCNMVANLFAAMFWILVYVCMYRDDEQRPSV